MSISPRVDHRSENADVNRRAFLKCGRGSVDDSARLALSPRRRPKQGLPGSDADHGALGDVFPFYRGRVRTVDLLTRASVTAK